MIEISKAIFTDEVVEQLIELSFLWSKEDITNGLIPNNKDDLKEPCYIATIDNKIVGYIFGHYYNNEKKVSIENGGSIPIGEKCFDIDELYVVKEYRNQGIGKRLFESLEKEVKGNTNYITLGTSTKDYRKIFHFYIEEVDMTFHSAFLYKKI